MNNVIPSSFRLAKPVKSFSKKLIYNPSNYPSRYNMVNEQGEFVGTMSAFIRERHESAFYKCDLPYKTFHIATLDILEKHWNKGYGSAFIDFAKRESYKQDCDGKVSLVAHHPGRPPHLFYYKKGFITPSYQTNEFFEKCLEEKRTLNSYPAKDMFLPLKKEHLIKPRSSHTEEKQIGFRQKMLEIFNILRF